MIIGGLIVTHGKLGEVLINEVTRLMSDEPLEKLHYLATDNMSAEQISAEICNQVGDKTWVIFTDCPGTAPTVRSLACTQDNQVVITGVNLPMLLSFIVNRSSLSLIDLSKKIINDGLRSMEAKWPIQTEHPQV